MAVGNAITLPAAAPLGRTSLVPLGGDGNSAPKSKFEVFHFGVAGDATGGNAALTITLDELYESVVTYVGFHVTSPAADSEVVLRIVSRNAVNAVTQDSEAHLLAAINPEGNATALWAPPPIFNATQIVMATPNVDVTEVYFVSVTVLNFNKRASERTPLNILLASLPRGTSSQNNPT